MNNHDGRVKGDATATHLFPEAPVDFQQRAGLDFHVVGIGASAGGIEALSKGGTVAATTRRVDDTVEIAVSDTGPGIPAEVGRRLFEQFFTTKPQGTGLGLSISRQIVEEHGGQIRWTSTPGAGATFTVSIPLARVAHA